MIHWLQNDCRQHFATTGLSNRSWHIPHEKSSNTFWSWSTTLFRSIPAIVCLWSTTRQIQSLCSHSEDHSFQMQFSPKVSSKSNILRAIYSLPETTLRLPDVKFYGFLYNAKVDIVLKISLLSSFWEKKTLSSQAWIVSNLCQVWFTVFFGKSSWEKVTCQPYLKLSWPNSCIAVCMFVPFLQNTVHLFCFISKRISSLVSKGLHFALKLLDFKLRSLNF